MSAGNVASSCLLLLGLVGERGIPLSLPLSLPMVDNEEDYIGDVFMPIISMRGPKCEEISFSNHESLTFLLWE